VSESEKLTQEALSERPLLEQILERTLTSIASRPEFSENSAQAIRQLISKGEIDKAKRLAAALAIE
jgi:hypothetical protein